MGIKEIRLLKQKALEPKPKKAYRIPAKSAKKLAREKEEADESGLKEAWFKERRKEMTGKCWHCGDPSCKNNNEYFRHSIAHILPKNIFESVKYHPLNWIELCFWNKSHHTNFDNKTLDIIELNCFDEVIKRFVSIYPDIAPNERKYIPDVLLQYIETEK